MKHLYTTGYTKNLPPRGIGSSFLWKFERLFEHFLTIKTLKFEKLVVTEQNKNTDNVKPNLRDLVLQGFKLVCQWEQMYSGVQKSDITGQNAILCRM